YVRAGENKMLNALHWFCESHHEWPDSRSQALLPPIPARASSAPSALAVAAALRQQQQPLEMRRVAKEKARRHLPAGSVRARMSGPLCIHSFPRMNRISLTKLLWNA